MYVLKDRGRICYLLSPNSNKLDPDFKFSNAYLNKISLKKGTDKSLSPCMLGNNIIAVLEAFTISVTNYGLVWRDSLRNFQFHDRDSKFFFLDCTSDVLLARQMPSVYRTAILVRLTVPQMYRLLYEIKEVFSYGCVTIHVSTSCQDATSEILKWVACNLVSNLKKRH